MYGGHHVKVSIKLKDQIIVNCT
uniref:Uncharacterized protein n=1 Tax=Tetranychus urticae TaxID=32264 RepID=T1L3J9_TETUR